MEEEEGEENGCALGRYLPMTIIKASKSSWILAKFGTNTAFDLVMPACSGISGADRVFPFFFCPLVIPQCEDLDRPSMHDVVCPSPVANRIFFNAMQMYNTWGGGNWEK